MNRNLLIQILKSLEKEYPSAYNVEKLTKELNLTIEGEFSKTIRYLKTTPPKVTHTPIEKKYLDSVGHSTSPRDNLLPQDELTITSEGIDFLTKLNDQKIEEEKSKIITKATVVLAIGVFIQSIIYFQQFSKDVKNITGALMLGVIALLLFVIFGLIWGPLTSLLKRKSL